MSFTVREASVPVSGAFVWAAKVKVTEEIRRRRTLRRFDFELDKGNDKAALTLLKQAGLRGFGSATLVPKRTTAMPRQELLKDDSASFDSLVDPIMNLIKDGISEEALLTGVDDSLEKESYRSPHEDHQMCSQHEAGHFLVGYLVGVLPTCYVVPSVEDLLHDKFAEGYVQFRGFKFLKEERRSKISSQKLNKFLCVVLGGIAAEHLVFGYADSHYSDVEELNGVLRWLCFNEDEANSLVRWAALNTLSLLSHHQEARSRLAEAMASRRSIGYCIDMIESAL